MHLGEPHGLSYEPLSARLVVTDKAMSCGFVHEMKGSVTDVLATTDTGHGRLS